MATPKTKKVWDIQTVQTRGLKDYLNKLEEAGASVFAILPSITISGSAEVVSFSKVQVVEPSKAVTDAATAA